MIRDSNSINDANSLLLDLQIQILNSVLDIDTVLSVKIANISQNSIMFKDLKSKGLPHDLQNISIGFRLAVLNSLTELNNQIKLIIGQSSFFCAQNLEIVPGIQRRFSLLHLCHNSLCDLMNLEIGSVFKGLDDIEVGGGKGAGLISGEVILFKLRGDEIH